MKEFSFNFNKFCNGCNWCCYDESPYNGNKKITSNKECKNLETNKCSIYSERPFDCRIFPIDVKQIKNKVVWILWENCPALKELDVNRFIDYIEKELLKYYSYQHILNHINHDNANLPKKYDKIRFRVIKEVCWGKQ